MPLTTAVEYILLTQALSGTTLTHLAVRESQNHDFFYVSPAGSDQWSGRLPARNSQGTEGPLATLTGARNAIRELKAAGQFKNPVTVMVLQGTYYLEEPLVLGPKDTGTPEQPITYTAYPGHQPILSGGRPVTGWEPYQGSILQTHLPEVKGGQWKFRQLFWKGQRQVRARWPRRDPQDPLYGGWAFIETVDPEKPTEFRFEEIDPPWWWAQPEQAEINVFPWYCWVNDLIPVEQIDPAKRTITVGRSPHFDMPFLPGNRFYVENVLEELDEPGEWCLDSETGMLYFWPPDGSVQDGEVTAPYIDTLIELRGTPENPIQHVTFAGLTFTETLSPFPEHLHPSHHSPCLRGVAVSLEHCQDCRVEDNRFTLLGGDAVRLQNDNARNQIQGNEIASVGGAGISLASREKGNTDTWADPAVLAQISQRYPKLIRNVISNNHIHHCGVLKKNCGGLQLYGINSVDNVISHNLIHDMSDKGLVMQDGFGRFIVEYNEMYQLGLEIADTGGIMTNRWFVLEDDEDLAHGNIIRFNLIRDAIGCGAYAEERHPKGEGSSTQADGRIWSPYYAWGIYFDNSGMEITVYGNVVIANVLGGVSMPVGSPKNNHVENNIFVEGSGNQMDLRMGGEAQGNRFLRNIIYYTDPAAMLLSASPNASQTIAQCDYNLYFPAAGQELRVRGIGDGSFAAWRELGFDSHSLITDPLFVDAAAGDYRLRPESPAFQLGFRPIPIERIGLQGKYRADDTGK